MCDRCDYLTEGLSDARAAGDVELIDSIHSALVTTQREHQAALDALADEYGSPDD